MRLSVAIAALCAAPILAAPCDSVFVTHPHPGKTYSRRDLSHDEYKHKNHEAGYYENHEDKYDAHHYDHDEYRHHPHQHHYYQHGKFSKKIDDHHISEVTVCEKLNHFSDKAERIYELVRAVECDSDKICWEEIRKAIAKLEAELDCFDAEIDRSHIDKCFNCAEESKIACCYNTYAESIIRLLRLLKEKTEYLDGETDRFILTAINSLRAADYTFIYELGRRMHCIESVKSIMKKQGAVDGTTKGSVREAFAKFVFTPLVTGDDFKEKPYCKGEHCKLPKEHKEYKEYPHKEYKEHKEYHD